MVCQILSRTLRGRFRLAVVLAAHVVLCCGVASADWTTWLNGPERVGATEQRLPRQLELKWVYTSPAPPEMAWEGPRSEPIEGLVMRHRVSFDKALQVAVAGGKLYFGSSVDHQLHCVEAATGKPLWDFYTDGAIRLAPTIWEDKVYFGSDDGFVYCLRAADGGLVWKHRVGPADERLLGRGRLISRWPVRTGVLVDDKVAYFGGGVIPHETVFLCAVNAETGEVLWKNDHISQEDAGRNPLSPQGYLLCSDQLLFVPSGRSLPAAFDRRTGEQVYQKVYSWRSTAGGVVGGSRALLADGQIYAAGDHHFLALDQQTGAVGFAFIQGHEMSLSGDKAFVANGRRIAGLDRRTHAAATVKRQQLAMQQSDLQRRRSSMKTEDYQVENARLTREINALSQVGSLWETPSSCDSALIMAGDLVVAGGQGLVVGLEEATGQEAWSLRVEGEAAGLAVSDGQLWVSTDRGKIYCFGAPGEAPSSGTASAWPAAYEANPFPQDALSPVIASAAEEILERTGIDRGFCLVLGSHDGRLAYELARRTQLRIYGVEADSDKVHAARRALSRAGLYGSRITLIHCDPAALPLPNYFANLVVSETFLHTGQVPGDVAEWSRCVKPSGGQTCFVLPAGAPAQVAGKTCEPLASALAATDLTFRGEIQSDAQALLATRDLLPGSGQWSHQYGDTGNTATSEDYRLQGGLGVLWYGDPGPSKMINRHEAAAAPLSTGGRMFIQGTSSILAYDAYNGLFLWEYANPGAIRTGVFNNEEPSNLAAADDSLFVAVDDKCTQLDAATGKVRATFQTPPSTDEVPRTWGFVAHLDGMLFGTSTIRSELAAALRRRGHTVDNATDAIFAVDLATGRQKWLYRGKHILHVTIAIGDGHVYFIDSSISSEQREALLREDKSDLQQLGPEEAKKKEEELKQRDVRLAVCLDANTGQEVWSRPVDVTDCSRIGIGGGNLTLMYRAGRVVICGANANGHYWPQFLSGQFDRRRIVVLDAGKGDKLWAKDANYRHRPIIVGDEVLAEPWSFNLHTGEEKKREHPVTGEETTWQFSRPGHHCGPITATPNMLFFRSGFTAYYDLYSDSGTSHFAGQRLGCWVNAIPGNGLLMIPEASAGCVCQFSLAATIVMEPRAGHETWKIFSATGPQLPVKHLALNLGAPGDRRDGSGTLWLGYPRPATVGRLEYDFQIQTDFVDKPDYVSYNDLSRLIENADPQWLFTSAARGLKQCRIPLLAEGDEPANYRVKLYFAELDAAEPGQRVFDVRLQGTTVASGLDIVARAGGKQRALVQEFDPVAVSKDLVIELVPAAGGPLPVLSAIKVERVE